MNNSDLEKLVADISKNDVIPISPAEALAQIKIFEKGIPFLKLVKSCAIGDGIKIIPEDQHDLYINKFHSVLSKGRVVKFVPASGAATRMFKRQMAVLNKNDDVTLERIEQCASNDDEDCKETLLFINNIKRFAFYDELKNSLKSKGKNLDNLLTDCKVDEVLHSVVSEDGLDYSNLPKGCILFHGYPDGSRTAFEEHLVEAMNYSSDENKVIKIHFTISSEHESQIKKLFRSLEEKYKKEGWTFDVQFSFQSPSTDTISVTTDNKPFRDNEGKIVFRPGGHGALLKNLDELKADIVSIKNIDNVVPDYLKEETYKYKKILVGYLIVIQEKIFNYISELENNQTDDKTISEIIQFIKEEIDVDLQNNLNDKSLQEKQKFLLKYLYRPIRVCGMVKKEEHPGGGPFWVESENGEISKQIVESAQIDMSDANQKRIYNEATHFNPVDIVCGVKDFKASPFQLNKFANPDTGLIVKKSKDGRELKALELPGLWNGGMYHWLTIFVEVPKITFNPVKEVNDLLRPEHQPKN